jgi:uncharacterized protein YndB with AHSA1/START domain
MERLRYSVVIQAPRDKTWNTMLGDQTYRQWTEPFASGSHYVGSWNEGSEILFLAPGEQGRMSGMVSRIEKSQPHQYLSIEHLGMVEDGERDTTSDKVQSWAGAREAYTFRETDGGTEVIVEVDTADEYKSMFQDTWPKALQRLKELAER